MERTTKTSDDFYDTIEHAATVAAPLFNLYGWTYGTSGTKHNDLVEMLTGLVDTVLEQFNKGNDDCYVGCGRFIVTYREYEEERELRISLELASEAQFKEFN